MSTLKGFTIHNKTISLNTFLLFTKVSFNLASLPNNVVFAFKLPYIPDAIPGINLQNFNEVSYKCVTPKSQERLRKRPFEPAYPYLWYLINFFVRMPSNSFFGSGAPARKLKRAQRSKIWLPMHPRNFSCNKIVPFWY